MAETIRWEDGKITVPDHPTIPFIEGDGTGADIWRASKRVFDAAVAKAYGGKRKIEWLEVLAGEKAFRETKDWLPQATIDTLVKHRVSIKGPLTTPVGGGIRSLNVTLRQQMDLYQCVRPVKYYRGVPSPMKEPEKVDMVIYRENTEDVYAGIEWKAGSDDAKKAISALNSLLGGKKKIREESGIGIKPISSFGSKRLIRAGIQYALDHRRPAGDGVSPRPRSVTLVHKGNIMKFTEGAFRDWGYEVATQEFRAQCVTERESWILDNKEKNAAITTEQNAAMIEPGVELANDAFKQQIYAEVSATLAAIWATHGGGQWKKKLLVKDRIADSMFQQALLRPEEYDVLCTPNLNGDYISDALAAQVGGIGIAPGSNVGDGYAVFEATHGTAPKYAGQDKVNPGSVILSGVMMLEYLGWNEAARMIESGLQRTIDQRRVTYDFHRTMPGATLLKCSEFATAICENM